ncbi:hypothetical protein PAAG_11305 [Paracoccidioides lutzii Pb01]|uniref:Uncharacterized protein n=1 Tax=Paracoccidioides lutzii (strain ATCC MYA-826 / Pb01) TaxID=502779 RepID=A0A0A2V719_PARBA|nr:hypothetical protein PAAG_11305 [Paracoccidioides lutzii Pb01]KGQ01915.1 hypothetical protein PAAG_11305 [Paracoccidioides lutzii Pb01]
MAHSQETDLPGASACTLGSRARARARAGARAGAGGHSEILAFVLHNTYWFSPSGVSSEPCWNNTIQYNTSSGPSKQQDATNGQTRRPVDTLHTAAGRWAIQQCHLQCVRGGGLFPHIDTLDTTLPGLVCVALAASPDEATAAHQVPVT